MRWCFCRRRQKRTPPRLRLFCRVALISRPRAAPWYPESMEAWGRGIVIQQGAYVCMVVSAEHQDEISEGFNNLFL